MNFLKHLIAGIIICLPIGFGNASQKEQMVSISTTYGDMLFVLYNETPAHRDNFIKLIKEGYYNEAIFNRVIKNFMIQGGESKQKKSYTIPAEINMKFIHKKGVLAAAREDDSKNPERRSSATQFYIVHGKCYKDKELDALEKYYDKKFTRKERDIYKNLGGAAHLDGQYTVFGELIFGFEVVDAIAQVETGRYDRPLKDIKMKVSVLE